MYILFFTKLVLLNVLRDWRKNLIACSAITIGTISLILFGGYVSQMYEGIRLGSIYSQLGHYQVQDSGSGGSEYAKRFIAKDLADEVKREIEKLEEVKLVTPRIEAQGLISFGDKSVGVLAYGVEADEDAEVSVAVSIVQGTGLFSERPEGALIGKELMEELGGSLGDVMTFLTTTSSGAINAVDIVIVGIMDTGIKELNKRFIKINLPIMNEVLYNDDITNLVVLADEEKLSAESGTRIEDATGKVSSTLTVKSWSDMSEQYHQIVRMFDNIFGFVTALVVIVVFAAIVNTMTMGVMERVSELSTIRALGCSSREVILLIIAEGIVVGLVGVAIGVLGGVLVSVAVNYAEISMPKPPGSTFSYPLRILLDHSVVWYPAVLTLGATLVGGLLPALRAGSLPINESIQR